MRADAEARVAAVVRSEVAVKAPTLYMLLCRGPNPLTEDDVREAVWRLIDSRQISLTDERYLTDGTRAQVPVQRGREPGEGRGGPALRVRRGQDAPGVAGREGAGSGPVAAHAPKDAGAVGGPMGGPHEDHVDGRPGCSHGGCRFPGAVRASARSGWELQSCWEHVGWMVAVLTGRDAREITVWTGVQPGAPEANL